MFRGNLPARIDDRGRLKIPAGHRAVFEARQYGRDVFVTSLTGESVRIYPMVVWADIEAGLATSKHKLRNKVGFRVALFGTAAELDDQWRVLIPPRLRDSAQMSGEVNVLGHQVYLDVWNHDKADSRLDEGPLTEEDWNALPELGL